MMKLIIAILFWGGWGVADKMAVKHLHPAQACLVSVGFAALLVPVWWTQVPQGTPWNVPGIAWTALATFLANGATYCFLYYLKDHDAGQATSLSTLYLIITYVISLAFMGEHMSLSRAVGVASMVTGAWLVTR